MIGTDTGGFSLLELVVVLGIAALLFTLAIPTSFHRNDRAELVSSAKEVAAALRLTRSRAITAGDEKTFAVDVDHARYRAAAPAKAQSLPRGARIALYTADDERLSGSVGTIRFYPDGSSSGGGVALSLGGGRYDVLVDWLTGGVSIHEWHSASR